MPCFSNNFLFSYSQSLIWQKSGSGQILYAGYLNVDPVWSQYLLMRVSRCFMEKLQSLFNLFDVTLTLCPLSVYLLSTNQMFVLIFNLILFIGEYFFSRLNASKSRQAASLILCMRLSRKLTKKNLKEKADRLHVPLLKGVY